MIMTMHIIIALLSLATATYLVWRPRAQLIRAQYALITLTLATGGWLMIQGADVLHVCVSGLVYVVCVTVLVIVAKRRLAAVSARM